MSSNITGSAFHHVVFLTTSIVPCRLSGVHPHLLANERTIINSGDSCRKGHSHSHHPIPDRRSSVGIIGPAPCHWPTLAYSLPSPNALKKIRLGSYIDFKEMLVDNIALAEQLSDKPASSPCLQPPRRLSSSAR